MILLNFFIGLFAIFLSPHIYIYYRYPHLNYSLIISYGFILSFTGIWVITLVTYYFNIPNIFIYFLALFLVVFSLISLYKHRNDITNKTNSYIIWIASLISILPILHYTGTGFNTWDAIVSWHRWALELYNNEYHPINAAYPVLMPALWSVIYKIQGTSDIWWTARIALFTLPLFSISLLFALYNEYKDKTFLFIALFLYPYLIWLETIAGYVDMPVMIMGMLTLILLYSAEITKKTKDFEYYIYAALFMSGIASITKQAGIAFILFTFIYILLNLKSFTDRKKLLYMCIAVLLYFISYLSIYYLNASDGITGNIEWLKSISKGRWEDKQLLLNTFFSYPPNIPLLNPISSLFPSFVFLPYLMIFSFLLFILKENRKYSILSILSVTFLIIGFFAWGKYFSYDARNSYWVKTFLILFLSINLNGFFIWYQKKNRSSLFLSLPIIISIIIYFGIHDNTFAYNKQKAFQSKLATTLDNQKIINLFKNKNSCLHLYTNDFFLLYDWDLKHIQDKITAQEYDINFIKKSVINHCKNGAYIVFRASTPFYPIWRTQIRKLIKDKKIISVNNSRYLFFAPPYTTLSKGYFESRTELINKKISNPHSNVNFALSETTFKNDMYTIDGWAFIKNVQIDNTKKYILLKNKNNKYLIETKMIYRPDVTEHFKAKDLIKSGFQAYIYPKNLLSGEYEINIFLEDHNKQQYLINTQNKIVIK